MPLRINGHQGDHAGPGGGDSVGVAPAALRWRVSQRFIPVA